MGKYLTKVYCAVPTYDAKIYTDCALSLIDHKKNNNVEIDFFDGDSLITRSRNFIISNYYHKFGKFNSFDYFLFQDSDVSVEEKSISSLVSRNVDVVFAPIPLKSNLYKTPYGLVQSVVGIKNEVEPYFYETTFSATGFCLLSNKSIINLIKNAEENEEYYFDNHGFKIYEIFKNYANKNGFYFSEDWHFCKILNKIGFNIYVDSSFETIHWSSPENYWYRPPCLLSENVINNDFSKNLSEDLQDKRWVTNDFNINLERLLSD